MKYSIIMKYLNIPSTSLNFPYVHSLTHSISLSLTHSLSLCFTLSLTHSLSLALSLPHSLTLTLSPSLSHTLSISFSHTLSISLSHTLSLFHTYSLSFSFTLSPTHSPSNTELRIAWAEKIALGMVIVGNFNLSLLFFSAAICLWREHVQVQVIIIINIRESNSIVVAVEQQYYIQ